MDTVLNLLSSYPEINPYDIDPPIFNLIPAPIPEAAHDTEEFRKALRYQTRAYGMNPFIYQYGVCPLMPTARDVLEALKIPMENYTSPPPLPEAGMARPIEFLEEINPTGRVPIFKVRVHCQEGTSDIRALKLFPDHIYVRKEDQEAEWASGRKRGYTPPGRTPAKRFPVERDAYAHLLFHGICATGIVPMCFGWLKLSSEDIVQISKMPNLSGKARSLKRDREPPMGILLEYLPDAVTLSTKNITMDIAEAACRRLREIHTAFVLHENITGGLNVLLLPNNRVVFIDFKRSKTGGDPEFYRLDLVREFAWFWGLCYGGHLADQRIGL